MAAGIAAMAEGIAALVPLAVGPSHGARALDNCSRHPVGCAQLDLDNGSLCLLLLEPGNYSHRHGLMPALQLHPANRPKRHSPIREHK